MATLDIRLDRHFGMQSSAFGPIEVDLKQYFVMGRRAGVPDDTPWIHLGYICEPCETNKTPPFNGLESFRVLPQSAKDEIVNAVAANLGMLTLRSTVIPAPVVIDDEEDFIDSES
jgi:hypothetical protein